MKKKYVIGIDVGNTNSVIGLFCTGVELEVIHHWRITTRNHSTSDELGISILGFLNTIGIEPSQIQGIIYSSVVPSVDFTAEQMGEKYFQKKIMKVQWDMGLPLRINYPYPQEIGNDRLVNSCAAVDIYGGDLIIVDMGTATTFCTVYSDLGYSGGVIAPGLVLSMRALFESTAQLPMTQFCCPPDGILGKTTEQAVQSGFFYGWVGLLREILTRIKQKTPEKNLKVIATGGWVELVHQEIPNLFDSVDPLLTLKGLKCIYNHVTREN